MTSVSRRRLLTGTAAVVGATALTSQAGVTAAQAAAPAAAGTTGNTETGATARALTVSPQDVRYSGLTSGQNQLFHSRPDCVRLPRSTAQVVTAVQEAVSAGKRLSVRGGGHCYENFVDHPDVKVIIDMSGMRKIDYDPAHQAFVVEGGATLGETYFALFRQWGVTLPGGACYSVGVGGHVQGGGYGNLSRLHGLVVDYLYAVEVVVVDPDGRARAVVATREAGDPNRDLWWAHTGGGGGSFGVVTRYWFRSPTATGTDPSRLLPAPPTDVLVTWLQWPWAQLTEARFARLVRNYGVWNEQNSSPTSPYKGLTARLEPGPKAGGSVLLSIQMDTAVPNARQLLLDFVAAVNDGVGITPVEYQELHQLPWFQATGWPGFWMSNPTDRYKYKSSYHRKGLTDDQIGGLYRVLTDSDYNHPAFVVSIAAHGGQVNAVAPAATAQVHRDSVLKLLWGTAWGNPSDDAKHFAYIRRAFSTVYASTGGVPVPNAVTDGCYINYADGDLADPAWNRSGVAWHDLYWKQNYPTLQRAKSRWDRRDVFRHAQSIRLPATV
ncbi:FAD-binding protein [Streptomyces sp. QHH-9511]|uniref:FAD-binding oxidoreductase n=1 Tax=Streptomyces sp. QHH-9511 TaxID=2684468 RepID=UPI001317327E|nr:FAD-binding protein [Streptomyces sp. QHH-9511]QGZ50980.1 FAD-binding protein [Streptomyces sp. QHH-9511]